MILRSIVGRLIVIWLILGAWLIARAQTQAAERASLPQRGSELYWTAIDELADTAVQFAYINASSNSTKDTSVSASASSTRALPLTTETNW